MHEKYQDQQYSWVTLAFGIQLVIVFLIIILWTMRLVNKRINIHKLSREPGKVMDPIPCDEKMYVLAKKLVAANLEHDLEKMEMCKFKLAEYLQGEYSNLLMRTGSSKKQKDPQTTAKKKMMRRIRCTLIKHPYDQIGNTLLFSVGPIRGMILI